MYVIIDVTVHEIWCWRSIQFFRSDYMANIVISDVSANSAGLVTKQL